ncbi:MAG: hypothetical protein JSV80_13755 [Acidobacteriota bacterium]|nr:MAG: hypothetical protein JSV80_13755 [Acidobacteriota bacterium]
MKSEHTVALLLIWLCILVELVSPVPGPLAIGAAVVLLVKPAWFRRFVDNLYR